jgi:hypothetical protein
MDRFVALTADAVPDAVEPALEADHNFANNILDESWGAEHLLSNRLLI